MEKAEASEGDAAERLTRVIESIVRQLRQAAAEGGLSPTAASTLLRLSEGGPQRVTDLARLEGVSQPAMTQLADRLVKEGLAVRRASEDDGRVVLLDATAAGAATVDARHTARVGRVGALLDALSASEREQVIGALPAFERLAALRAHRDC
ncbi:MAG: MarR family transcriptional regulator [Microbacterium sp.]|uniref:MarR family winged helix-turn-helix transcriptional regulator n=1 Tax=Microbacterium sp. TaxID=51671 RepID=UPI0039E25F13